MIRYSISNNKGIFANRLNFKLSCYVLASNFVVPSCPTLKVTNADSADSNGQYEYLPAVRSPWAPDRPVYKLANNTGGSRVRYVFWTEGKGHGWVIGGPMELMKSGSFFHESKEHKRY